jgi:hypothetical protein
MQQSNKGIARQQPGSIWRIIALQVAIRSVDACLCVLSAGAAEVQAVEAAAGAG